jgi:hypothetical protein
MLKIEKIINKLSKVQKNICLVLILVFVLILSISVPFLIKCKNGNILTFDDSFSIIESNKFAVGNIITNSIANITINTNSWNNLRSNLNPIYFNSTITFSIEPIDSLIPFKEAYYYISNSNVALTQEELSLITSWNLYSNNVQISEEGSYIVYAKIIDTNDDIAYINTDSLVLDLTNPSATVTMDDTNWTNLRSSLNNIYIDRQKNITIVANDNLSSVSSIKYYITDQILNTSDLNALNENSWNVYSSEILISDVGTRIIYVKVIDNSNNITYINTDYIVLSGYTESLIVGRNPSSYLGAAAYITNKSTVTLNISYSNNSASELSGYTHNLISYLLLPLNTKITLIDHITSKVYEYKVPTSEDNYNYNNSCPVEDVDCIKVATYPFTLFKEVGTGATDIPFSESTYYSSGTINENFTVVLDLSNTSISTNHNNVMLYMELHDSSNINVRPTLYSTIGAFNIYSNTGAENASASLYLTTDYSGSEILFNSNSSTDINITSGLNYKHIDTFQITDTTYEDKEIGLSIKLVDSNGNIVDKEYLKNIIFKVGNSIYYPGADNIVRINFNNGIADVTKALTIITYENNSNLTDGTYYFKISNFVSDDGYYYNELNNNELSIPVNVLSNSTNITYSFDVIMDNTNRIISKANSTVKVSFNILQNGFLTNPNIRISLYKKSQLTAYDQSYEIVDLANYVSDTLNICGTNVYYVSTSPVQYNAPDYLYNIFELNLIPANFENIGYKFVFDLYDGTKKIGTIEKHFIVR